jgi:hypothetical protein
VIFLSAVLLYCSAAFYLHAHRKGSVAFQLLAFSLALWAVLLASIQSNNPVDGDVWQRRSRPRPGAADAAGHRDGDGAV